MTQKTKQMVFKSNSPVQKHFLFETLMQEVKPVVAEKIEFE